jgi:hypothetical protein
VPEGLTARFLTETIRAFEGSYEAELKSFDGALAFGLQLASLALALYPLSGVILSGLRKSSEAIERRAALLCGVCGTEVQARTVRCPSCAVVFPSPVLRGLALLASLWLAWWTAGLRAEPWKFMTLISFYLGSATWVALWFLMPASRARPSFAWPAAAFSVAFEGIVRIREFFARLSALFDMALLLLYWFGLILVCHSFGWPLALDDPGISDILGKLALASALLAVVAFALSLWMLRPPFGLSLALTSFVIGLILGLLALLSHGAGALVGTKLRFRPEEAELRAFRAGDEAVYLSFRGVDQSWSRAVLRLAEPGRLELSSSRVCAERAGWACERISQMQSQSWEGPAFPGREERTKNLGVWQILWEPENALLYFSGATPPGRGAGWLSSLEIVVKDDAQRWIVELPVAEELLLRIEEGKLIQKNLSSGELKSLEAK